VAEGQEIPGPGSSLFDIHFAEIPPLLQELIGAVYLDRAALLGRRTGELHIALASGSTYPDFAPEPFSLLYQRSIYQSMRSLTRRSMQLLSANREKLPAEAKEEASRALASETKILDVYRKILGKKINAMRIRFHGDYHLGQVLFTGKDFVIIDFEGEPARSLSERRLKRSPVRDVAGMIRSFHYAVYSALLKYTGGGPDDSAGLQAWAEVWYHYVSGTFLSSYMNTVRDAGFVPEDRDEFALLLQCFLLEKAVYELGYELNNRPEWVLIPLRGISHILKNL
jgi:maltose alpha-D-glucosyltransferase/alpha-amylase